MLTSKGYKSLSRLSPNNERIKRDYLRLALGQNASRSLPGLARAPQGYGGVDTDCEHLLDAIEAVGQAPSLGAVGRNPQLQSTSIGEFEDLGARFGAAYLAVGEGYVGISTAGVASVPTNVPTIDRYPLGTSRTGERF